MNRYDIILGKAPPTRPIQKEKNETEQVFANQERTNIINQYMSTVDGRQRLASSMVELFRQRLNNRSFVRRIFTVEQLPNGAIPVYDKDLNATAYVVGARAQGYNVLAIPPGVGRAVLPIFEVNSNSMISSRALRESTTRVNNLVDAPMERALQDFVREEEIRAIHLFGAITAGETRRINSINDFTHRVILDAMSRIEALDLRVANILINNQDFLLSRLNFRDALDIETHRELIENGIVATIYGAQVNISSNVPSGQIYILPEPSFAGIFAERAFSCSNLDDPRMREIGFSFYEQIGMGVLDSNRVVKISISRG